MLKEIMTPIDLHEPRPKGQAGFLTLKVASLPPVEFDLKRILLRSPATEVKTAIKEIKQATPVEESWPIKAVILKLPKKRPSRAKKPKFKLGNAFDQI
jgi:hypothetical protein